MTSLSEYVAATLGARADALGAHWRARAVAATPRGGAASEPDDVDAERATAVVRAVAAGLGKDARPAGEVIRLGWQAGRAAHAGGLTPHHVQRDAELLVAVLLAAAEGAVAAAPADVDAGGAAAFATARRLHALGARYAQGGLSGFLHAALGELRARWRVLRHDLRSPIGTIQGAIALMEDETIPLETRQGPRMRQMVTRNADSLVRLVSAGLDDRQASTYVGGAQQEVALRDVALAARREVREVAQVLGCEVRVADDVSAVPALRADAGTLELALTTLLLAGLARAEPGDVLTIAAGGHDVAGDAERPGLAVAIARPDGTPRAEPWDADGVALAGSLLGAQGGRLEPEGAALRVALPARRAGDVAPAPAPAAAR